MAELPPLGGLLTPLLSLALLVAAAFLLRAWWRGVTRLSRRRAVAVPAVEEHPHLDRAGIYAWFVDRRGRALFRRAGLRVHRAGHVYIGMTKDSFRRRVLGQHIRGHTQELRAKLRGILIENDLPSAPADVKGLMDRHLRVALWPKWTRIEATERRLIRKYRPCLNIRGLEGDPNAGVAGHLMAPPGLLRRLWRRLRPW